MGFAEFISETKKELSDAIENLSVIAGKDTQELIEEKEELEKKIRDQPVTQSEWQEFSGKLDAREHEDAEDVANKHGWERKTKRNVLNIYVNTKYYDGVIPLSNSQQGSQQEVYDSAEIMREIEEALEAGNMGTDELVEKFNTAHNKLEEALNRVTKAERELEKARSTVDYFNISGEIEEELEQKESLADKTRKEIKSVNQHVTEMRDRIT